MKGKKVKNRSSPKELIAAEVLSKQWFPDFSPQFKEDLSWWYKTAPNKVDKIFDLVTDIMKHPFEGLGKPEPLKYLDPDTWSRRIDLENRIVYRVSHERVDFLQARYHY